MLHTTYRLTMRSVSAPIIQWGVKFTGYWDSAFKGNSALRAHVARAAGIELAHSEGQHVIHFLWDMWKFYDSIKACLLIPQLVARGHPIEKRSLSEFVQALGYVVPGSVHEEHIDDLSQFVTNTSRRQLLHDAAPDRQTSERRHSQAGANPVLQFDSLGKRQIAGKADRWPLRGSWCFHLCRGSSHRLGDRNCSGEEEMCGKPMEAHLERQTKGSESQPLALAREKPITCNRAISSLDNLL